MQYLLLFLEGIITFISPCLLPMLPVYISFFAAGEVDKGRALINALGFVLGFTFVFVLLGAFAGTLGKLLTQYTMAVNIVMGAVVVLLGLNFMGVINIKFLSRGTQKSSEVKNLRFFSSVLFGVVFSVGWTPCVGAFLGSALMMASQQGGTVTGVVMLLIYSLGLGIPFVVSAILLDRLKGAFGFIKRHYRAVNIISGALLITVGILMMTGIMGRFLALITF